MDGKLQLVLSQGDNYCVGSQALYRKWRSQTFDEVVGQEHITQTLKNALRLGRVRHAYLFTGPRGTGKTSTARLLAKAVNCLAGEPADCPGNHCSICRAINEGRLLDLIEIDAASNTGVDDIRDLRERVNFQPSEAQVKFYIIDEVHMLSNSAFNALLKTLEEPPSHVIFVLATTEPEKIPATITSRCQRFDFKRISVEDVVSRLTFIIEQENMEAEPAALHYIAKQGGGSMRDALSLLDQLTAYGGERITLERVRSVVGAVTSQTVIELVEALINRNIAEGLDIINQVINQGVDARQFGRGIVEHLRSVMLVKFGDANLLPDFSAEALQLIQQQAAKIEAWQLVQATELFNNALFDLKSSLLAIAHLPLELAFVESTTISSQKVVTEPVATSPPTPTPKPVPSVSPKPTEPSITTAKPAADGLVDRNVVNRCFPKVVQDIESKNKLMAEVLRNNAKLHKVEGNEIYFVVEEQWKGRFEQPAPQIALNDAFSKAIQQSVVIRFLSQEKLHTQAESEGGPEILVEAAVEELGGQIYQQKT